MAVNEQGHYGKYSGNARCCMGHPHTRVDRYNYKPTERDDAAHISYLKRDIIYDAHHGHDDEKMVADEKHISKLAGDMRYDKEHHGPGKHIKGDPMEGHYGTHFEADRRRIKNMAMKKAAGQMRTGAGMANELAEEAASGIIEGTISSQIGLGKRTKGIIERSGIQNFKPDVNENISDADRLKRGKMSDLNYLYSKKGDGPGDFAGGYHKVQHAKGEAHKDEGPAKHCFGPAKYAYDSPSKRYCIK